MWYSLIFFGLGCVLIRGGLQGGVAGWLLLWGGASFWAAGAAYGWLGARVFGKRSDGSLAKPAVSLLLPYLLLIWGIWHVQRFIGSEECYNEIGPGIWLGRRPLANELPAEISLIVDMTAEFPAVREAIAGRAYICVPALDASVPASGVFQALIERICAWRGNVYIHCALGHGRSATVAAAVLVAKGLAANVKEAEAILKKARPGISFTQAQRQLLEKWSGVGL